MSDKYKNKKYYETIETRMGINSLIFEKDLDINLAEINLIYQKNYPKTIGGATDKLNERIT